MTNILLENIKINKIEIEKSLKKYKKNFLNWEKMTYVVIYGRNI